MSPETKKILIPSIIAIVVVAVLGAIAIGVGCFYNYPNRTNDARFVGREVRVRLSDDWTQEQSRRVGEALTNMSRAGVTFRRARADESRRAGELPILFLRRGEWSVLDNESRTSPRSMCQAEGTGRYDLGSNEVWVDPGCAPGAALVTAVMHEIGHWIGMMHICQTPREVAPAEGQRPMPELALCSPVGYGSAFMNPSVSYGDDEIGFDEAAMGPLSTTLPTRLDLAEFDRAWPALVRRWGAR